VTYVHPREKVTKTNNNSFGDKIYPDINCVVIYIFLTYKSQVPVFLTCLISYIMKKGNIMSVPLHLHVRKEWVTV
jgi:hypothetical protein